MYEVYVIIQHYIYIYILLCALSQNHHHANKSTVLMELVTADLLRISN
jgi:hypothetical protein